MTLQAKCAAITHSCTTPWLSEMHAERRNATLVVEPVITSIQHSAHSCCLILLHTVAAAHLLVSRHGCNTCMLNGKSHRRKKMVDTKPKPRTQLLSYTFLRCDGSAPARTTPYGCNSCVLGGRAQCSRRMRPLCLILGHTTVVYTYGSISFVSLCDMLFVWGQRVGGMLRHSLRKPRYIYIKV
jgi:hypothetical protein